MKIQQIKQMINEAIVDALQNEIGAVDYNNHDPIASKDDFAGDHLNDLTDTVHQLIKQVETETGDYDSAYNQLVKIYKQLTDAIDNPRLSNKQRKNLEHDYEGILGNIHRIIGGGGGGSEKMYVAEALSDKNKQLIIKWVNEMGSRKAAIRMIDSILKSKIGLGTDDLPDTATFADGIDGVEEALQQHDYDGAYEIAYDTAREMIEDEGGDGLFEVEGDSGKFSVYYQEKNPSSVSKTGGWAIAKTFSSNIAAEKFAKDPENINIYGQMSVDTYNSEYDDLFECGSWKEAIKHPMFKEAILKEKAPPGYNKATMNRIVQSLEKAHPDWSEEKIARVAFASAWKQFHNSNK